MNKTITTVIIGIIAVLTIIGALALADVPADPGVTPPAAVEMDAAWVREFTVIDPWETMKKYALDEGTIVHSLAVNKARGYNGLNLWVQYDELSREITLAVVNMDGSVFEQISFCPPFCPDGELDTRLSVAGW